MLYFSDDKDYPDEFRINLETIKNVQELERAIECARKSNCSSVLIEAPSLRYSSLSINEIKNKVKRNLTSFLKGLAGDSNSEVQPLKRLTKITFDLNDVFVWNNEINLLSPFLSNLEQLILKSGFITQTAIETLILLLSQSPKLSLKKLAIHVSPHPNNPQLLIEAPDLTNLTRLTTSLEEVSLSRVTLNSKGAKCLATLIKNNSSIKSLAVSECGLQLDGFKELVPIVPTLTKFKYDINPQMHYMALEIMAQIFDNPNSLLELEVPLYNENSCWQLLVNIFSQANCKLIGFTKIWSMWNSYVQLPENIQQRLTYNWERLKGDFETHLNALEKAIDDLTIPKINAKQLESHIYPLANQLINEAKDLKIDDLPMNDLNFMNRPPADFNKLYLLLVALDQKIITLRCNEWLKNENEFDLCRKKVGVPFA